MVPKTPMRYRKLGNTGLAVSEIAFGTIAILAGNVPVLPDYYSLDTDSAVAVMKYAFDRGCNLYDTAIVPEYGDAEIKLGVFTGEIGRDRIVISDKARFFDGVEMYEAVLTSCENLGTYSDIYFVHQVDEGNVDQTFGKYGAVEALCELKRNSKIRFAGIASHYHDVLLRGAKDERIDVLQGSGNIFERGMLDRIEKEPLFMQKGFPLNKVYAAGILPQIFPTSTLISGALSYPVSCAVIGMGTYSEIDAAMEYDGYERLSFNSVVTTLSKHFSPILCDRCRCCRCKYGTEIHILLRQYNYYFFGKDHWALRKLDLGIKKSAEFCRRCIDMPCLERCPKKIRIPLEIEKIRDLVRVHVRNGWIW